MDSCVIAVSPRYVSFDADEDDDADEDENENQGLSADEKVAIAAGIGIIIIVVVIVVILLSVFYVVWKRRKNGGKGERNMETSFSKIDTKCFVLSFILQALGNGLYC